MRVDVSRARDVRLRLLGSFSLETSGRRVAVPGTTQRLLAFLAINRGPLHRTYVSGTLWPETSESRASGNLRTALWRFNATGGSIVRIDGDCLSLDPAVGVDLYEVGALAQAVVRGGTRSSDVRIDGLSSSAELLPGWYEEWVAQERETLRELRLRALERLCHDLAAADQFGDAIEAGLAAIAGDPLRESSHRALIGAYLLEGNHALALRQYRHYRDILDAELGVRPSHHMARLLDEHGLTSAMSVR
jgi:DNA-binding SARP family transcriptional activator